MHKIQCSTGYWLYLCLGITFCLCLPSLVYASTITVNTEIDAVSSNGRCSLREAVENANRNTALHADCVAGAAQPATDLILFNLLPVSSTLSLNSQLLVTDSLTINGSNGGTPITLNGQNATRLFTLNGLTAPVTPTITLDGLTLTNGRVISYTLYPTATIYPSGGAIDCASVNLNFIGGRLINNRAHDSSGGAINASQCAINIRNSEVSRNYAKVDGGAIDSWNSRLLNIENTQLISNTSGSDGGALYLNLTKQVSIRDATFNDNHAGVLDGGDGGAIYFSESRGAVAQSHFQNNSVQRSPCCEDGTGGAMKISSSTALTITNTLFFSNSAQAEGGGIAVNNASSVTITASTLDANQAGLGGGAIVLDEGSVNLVASTLSNNVALTSDGGAISNYYFDSGLPGANQFSITNSTISQNRAPAGRGGALFNAADDNRSDEGSLNATIIHNSTIVNNSANEAGGIYHVSFDPFDDITLEIANTIVAGNRDSSSSSASDDCFNSDAFIGSVITSTGYNLVGLGTTLRCSFTAAGDQTINPALLFTQVLDANLVSNGGPTPTHALLRNSPAIDGGDPTGCRAPDNTRLLVDQRERSRAGRCDIGAYEADQLSFVLTKTVGVNPGVCAATTAIVVNQGTSVYYCAIVRNTGNVTLTNHIVSDPALGLNVTLPLAVAPGGVVSLTNALVAGLGPIPANRTLSNTLILTSTGAGLSNAQRATAQVTVPAIDVIKTVGASPTDCVASSASWSTYAGAWRYYCVTVRNTSPFTLTQFTLVDPLLNLNQPIALGLPPSGTVQIDNALLNTLVGQPTLLGPFKTIALPENTAVIPDTVNQVIVTATGGGQTITGAPLRATNSAAATVIWSKPEITRTITTVGTDAVATRTITVTIYGQSNTGSATRLPLRDREVHLQVRSGNQRNNGPYPPQLTNDQGQVLFRYVSYGPATAVQAAAPQVCIPETVTVWVELDGDGGPDEAEPQTTDTLCTAVDLRSFSAQLEGGQVVIAWTTGVETANAGFNLYRSTALDGPYTQINPQLIGAQGDGAGATYRFVDTPVGSGPFYYQLEDVDYLGARHRHPPTLARPASATPGFTQQLYLPALWR